MSDRPIEGVDVLIDSLDYNQKCCGLAGNVAQLILHLEGSFPKEVFEERIKKWIDIEPALRFRLKRTLLKKSFWQYLDAPIKPHIFWHKGNDYTQVFDKRINTAISPSNPPLIALDIIQSESKTYLSITWHQLLADIRGGELLISRLKDPKPITSNIWCKKEAKSLIKNIKHAQGIHPCIKNIGKANITIPCSTSLTKAPFLKGKYLQFNKEESQKFRGVAKRIHPIFGETALLASVIIKDMFNIMDSIPINSGYFVPIPINLRAPGAKEPLLGNLVTFAFVYVDFKQIQNSNLLQLARIIGSKIVEQISYNNQQGIHAAFNIAQNLPRKIHHWFLKKTFQGKIASFLFSNTGLCHISDVPGQKTEFLGCPVVACFQRQMVTYPPGIGFFFLTYACKLHLSLCWIEDAFKNETVTHLLTSIENNIKAVSEK